MLITVSILYKLPLFYKPGGINIKYYLLKISSENLFFRKKRKLSILLVKHELHFSKIMPIKRKYSKNKQVIIDGI
jgi:hypothetical protein